MCHLMMGEEFNPLLVLILKERKSQRHQETIRSIENQRIIITTMIVSRLIQVPTDSEIIKFKDHRLIHNLNLIYNNY